MNIPIGDKSPRIARLYGSEPERCVSRLRRLDKSRRDLADPLRAGDSIAQIALACGFADFGHFSHRYKDAFGTSPREDRARMRSSRCQS